MGFHIGWKAAQLDRKTEEAALRQGRVCQADLAAEPCGSTKRGPPLYETPVACDRRSRMKNPFMSLWLSNANRALGVGRGLMTAEMRRQQGSAAKEAMRMIGLASAAKPKRKTAKRKAK